MESNIEARDLATRASRAVLVEVVTVLARFVDATVIVGGWVPELLYPHQGHVGSLDVDIAVDGRKLAPHVYETIRNALVKAGYRSKAGALNVFLRDLEQAGLSVEVKLDVITGEHAGPREERPAELIQGMMVSKLRGVDLGLDSCVKIDIEGALPGGERITRAARVPTSAVFICMKAITMQERMKDKDAYDVYFCLSRDPRGPAALGRDCAALRELPNVPEAIAALRRDFAALERNGPVWAARFSAEHGADLEVVRRDAFERVQAFLEGYDAAVPG